MLTEQMSKAGRTFLLICLFIPVWIASFLILSFIKSKGCGQIVVDSYEVRSGIDIPRVDFYSCAYDDVKDVRMSVYKLKINPEQYLNTHSTHFDEKHAFKAVDSKNISFALSLDEFQKPVSKTLYVSAGSRWGNSWQYVVEKETGKMWVEMKYTPTFWANILMVITWIVFHSPILFLAIFLFNTIKKICLSHFKRNISDLV